MSEKINDSKFHFWLASSLSSMTCVHTFLFKLVKYLNLRYLGFCVFYIYYVRVLRFGLRVLYPMWKQYKSLPDAHSSPSYTYCYGSKNNNLSGIGSRE